MKSASKFTIYGDGGSRGNPGEAAYGFAIFDENETLIYSEGKRLGVTTNNVAEYSSVINALRWVRDNNPEINEIHFKLDSMLVASQMSGKFRVKHPNMIELFAIARKLMGTIPAKITFTQIPRAQNKVADRLVNDALDYVI